MNPLEAFPGGADEARKFIRYMRDDEPKLSVRSQAVCDLALLGLDSLAAADPEREAKVEVDRKLAQIARRIDFAMRATENCAIIVPLDVQNELDALRVAVLGHHAPPSPSVAALRDDDIVVLTSSEVDDFPSEVSVRHMPSGLLVASRNETTMAGNLAKAKSALCAALAASNANAGGE